MKCRTVAVIRQSDHLDRRNADAAQKVVITLCVAVAHRDTVDDRAVLAVAILIYICEGIGAVFHQPIVQQQRLHHIGHALAEIVAERFAKRFLHGGFVNFLIIGCFFV